MSIGSNFEEVNQGPKRITFDYDISGGSGPAIRLRTGRLICAKAKELAAAATYSIKEPKASANHDKSDTWIPVKFSDGTNITFPMSPETTLCFSGSGYDHLPNDIRFESSDSTNDQTIELTLEGYYNTDSNDWQY